MTTPRRAEGLSLSIVVPVHNEEGCVEALVREIERHVDPLRLQYEIVFVDDASKDRTVPIIAALARDRPRVKGISLSRNMGHQVALCCGLEASTGDLVVTMDGDLQHPPSLIPQMVRLWEQGYDVVNTLRRTSSRVGFFEGLYSFCFYRIFNLLADVKLVPGGADFRLLDRAAVDALNEMPEFFKFFRGQIPYIGFAQTALAFDCPERFAGTRSYTIRQSLRLASNGLFSFSTFGLKLPFFLGLGILALVLTYGVVAAVLVATGVTHLAEGWTSLAVLIVLSMGVQLTFLGMFGLYLGKIFIEVKRRPLYFVKGTVGFGTSSRYGRGSTVPSRTSDLPAPL